MTGMLLAVLLFCLFCCSLPSSLRSTCQLSPASAIAFARKDNIRMILHFENIELLMQTRCM